jgi:phage gp36-like protein
MYVTLSQLADLPGARELAQVASTEHEAVVDAELMELTLRGGDRSGYLDEDIARADAAKARIEEAITETDDTIDAYLARRVTVPVPVPRILVQIARAFVRYELHKHLVAGEGDNPIVRDYRDKTKLLEAIRDGKVMLGATDPMSAGSTSAGDVEIQPGRKVFGDSQRGAW